MAREARAAPPTVDDVFRLASQGERYEIVDGELVEIAPTGLGHGWIEIHVANLIREYVTRRSLGIVVVGEVLCRLDPSGRQALAADVAFIRRDRVPSDLEGAFEGAPDLVIEIISPSDRMPGVRRKVAQWLEYGSAAVVLMFTRDRRIEVHRRGGLTALQGDDAVDLEPALPGFRAKVSELFPAST